MNQEAPGHATATSLATADAAYTMLVGAAIDRDVSADRFAWVRGLAEEIAAEATAGRDVPRQHRQVLDRIVLALAAHAGPDSLRTLLRLPAYLGISASDRLQAERWLATLVAHGHQVEDIAAVVYGEEAGTAASHEFKACLLHELVLQDMPVAEYPALRSFGEALVAEEHPLAALPLHLLPAERGLCQPPDAPNDWTWVLPPAAVALHSDRPEIQVSEEMRRRSADVDPTETTVPEVAEAMGAAVRHWREQSNGEIAAQEFWSPEPVSPDDVAAVFERLPLPAWPEGGPPARLHPASSDRVLRVLLTASLLSPAYGSGLYGAYGRLATWRSLAGLTGAPADARITDTAMLVEQTHWFIADLSSDWFNLVTRDLAVAALRPGGQEIAVLAATDTD
jgi:hypothetical protein